jgi:AraC-like DNA-binding protein
LSGQEDSDGYASRVTGLILDQLRRARSLPGALPWPRSGTLLKVCEAIERLGGGLGVTQTAMELGYGSTSAFAYAFRTDMGCGPQTTMRGRCIDHRILAASHAEDVPP